MDHIKLPDDASGTRHTRHSTPLLLPLIPYEYDPQDDTGFRSFAQRKGCWKNGRLDGEKPPSELARTVQSWLYFGLLSEVLGIHVNPGSFTSAQEAHTDEPTLSSSCLPVLFDTWQQTLRSLGPPACDRTLSRVKKIIDDAIEISIACDLFAPVDFEQYGRIMLSVKVLLVTLVHLYNGLAAHDMFSYRDSRMFPLSSSGGRSSAAAALLNYMRDEQICLQLAHRLCTSHNYMAAYYLTSLPQHRRVDHSKCSVSTCDALTIDPDTYRTKHVTSDCSCQHKKVDVQEISEIIGKGKTPVVIIRTISNNDVELSVKGVAGWSSYVAISHVWLDGLGNPARNSLPYCQLKRLQHMLGPTSSGGLWIDTLCIPVGSGHEEAKRQAISSMASIYQSATSVLILDAGIENLSDSQGKSEAFGRIICSAWNSRCWTYQESVLGKSLLFQTQDGLRSFGLISFETLDMRRFDPRHSRNRWFVWRFGHSRTKYFVAYARFCYSLMPAAHLFTTMFLLFCGPQAWQLCCEKRNNQAPSVVLQNLFICTTWLFVGIILTLLLLPASIYVMLAYWFMVFALACVAFSLWSSWGSESIPSTLVLELEMYIQLFEDLSAQLKPAAIDSGLKTLVPDLAANLQSHRFAHAWNSLVQRTATQPEDLDFIMADLTGVTASSLVNLRPADRMRAIVTRHTRLPLALLFDPRLARPECCDRYNPWLPSSPREHLLPYGTQAPYIYLEGSTLTIRPNELDDSYQWMTTVQHEDQVVAGLVIDTDPSNSSVNTLLRRLSFHPQCLDSIAECFLVDTTGSGELALYKAIKFEILRRESESVFCSFGGPVEIRLSSLVHMGREKSSASFQSKAKLCSHISRETSEAIPTGESDSVIDLEYSKVPGIYLAIAGPMMLIFTGIIGSQTTMIVFYIGLAIWLAILVPAAYATKVLVHLHYTQFDRRASTYLDSRMVKWVIAWLGCVNINFAYAEGEPPRWYHVLGRSTGAKLVELNATAVFE